jgi:hypothetical protein
MPAAAAGTADALIAWVREEVNNPAKAAANFKIARAIAVRCLGCVFLF